MTKGQWGTYCVRCGEPAYSDKCVHPVGLHTEISRDEAQRIRARYALGKLHNPDHDTTSYRDGKPD